MPRMFGKLPMRTSRRDEESLGQSDLPKIRQIYPPPALPKNRKRALTIPLPAVKSTSGLARRQWTSTQAHCGFLQMLPYDVRRIIYELLLADDVLHIIRLRKELSHIRCPTSNRGTSTCWGKSTVDGHFLNGIEHRHLGIALLDLPRTCRRIYTETIGIIYSRNTFDINGPECMVSFSSTLLPHRFSAIRSVQLTWAFFHPGQAVGEGVKILLPGDEALWIVCWATVSRILGLKDLCIWLNMTPAQEATSDAERDLLIPLMKIRPQRRFEVRVSWAQSGLPATQRQAHCPFRLWRQGDEDWGATSPGADS